MPKTIGRFASVWTLCTLAAGAWAGEITSDAKLEEMFAGSRLYTSEYRDPFYFSRTDLWLFGADGAVKANFAVWWGQPDGMEEVHMSVDGRWAVENGALCIQWDDRRDPARRCYRVRPTTGNQYGRRMFVATDVATSQSWKFALSR